MQNTLKGIKVAILMTDGFEQSEMTQPRKALQEAGAETAIVSPGKGKVKGWKDKNWGDEFDIDKTLSEANEADYDALLLPGGVLNPDKLRIDEKAVDFVKSFIKNHKPIAAICHGPVILINALGVKGKTLTSYSSIKQDLINAGANWIDQEAVRDGKLLTSRNPDDIPAFNQSMIELFSKGEDGKKNKT